MHMEYRVKLPDHDWVVAERHKLIPSVNAFMEIAQNQIGDPLAVKYSGPTYISIRSGKHSSSTAVSHANDFERVINHPEFKYISEFSDGGVKPVLIIISDGGPDENPRYDKVKRCAISHFKKFNLDAVFLATNAPGRSAFNRVERRMAPLSKELSGVILPHERYGSHLNSNGETVDVALEKQNFKHAGEVLSEIWNRLEFDGHKTFSEYIDPDKEELETIEEHSPEWCARHVREGHYFFQVRKSVEGQFTK